MSVERVEQEIVAMHHVCALRDNASSSIIKAMAQLGKPMNDAFAAALLTLGSKHAPIEETQQYFENYRNKVLDICPLPAIVPGFGSAWYKKQRDPAVETFFNNICGFSDNAAELVNDCDLYLEYVRKHTGKDIYPNAAMATVVANLALKRDSILGMGLVIQGRIAAWECIDSEHYSNRGFGCGYFDGN